MSARPTRLTMFRSAEKLASITARVGASRDQTRFRVVRATACATRLHARVSVPSGDFGIGCKRRSNNPSLKRPDFPVAPEQKSGSRYPFALGRQRVGDEGRGALWARSLRGSDRGDESSRGGATVWNRPSHGRQNDEFTAPPGYVRTKPPAKPKLDPFIPVIDPILFDDKSRPRKQQHTAKRIFDLRNRLTVIPLPIRFASPACVQLRLDRGA